jgi:class 3 adenylate cyclase/DNA-binding CsgD family transcriptional regulator
LTTEYWVLRLAIVARSGELDLTRVAFDAEASGLRLFMCRHTSSRPDRALADVAASHDLDLAFQKKHGVRWLSYFLDRTGGRSFCLAAAPSREAIEVCHLEAHGQMVPYRIIEVEWSTVQAFLGDIAEPGPGQTWESTPFRTILFALVANTASLAVAWGDTAAAKQLQLVQEIIRSAVQLSHGMQVRTDVDSVLLCFTSASRAVDCAIGISRELKALFPRAGVNGPDVRIGLNAGEPVSETGGLFGAAVRIAEDACRRSTRSGAILATEVVRDLCMGKTYTFEPRGQLEVSGADPMRLYEVSVPTGVGPVTGSRYPDHLTEREVEVLRLLAAGRSNQHIAEELVISLNTVARHVANILDKTNSTNRTEAAAYAYRERLT